MVARHRYLVADLVTDQPLGWVPLTGVSYSRRVNAQGDLTATLPVATAQLGNVARIMNQRPVAVYAERRVGPGQQGSLWWGGIAWASPLSRSSRGVTTCQVTGATFESIGDHRYLWDDLVFDSVDRGQVIASLWDHLQTRPGNSSIGLDVPAVAVGGDPWTGTWYRDQTPTYAEALAAVRELAPAFETIVDVWADPDGTRHRRLRIGTPLIGDQTLNRLLCSPRSLTSWGQPSDGTARPTHGMARGATVGSNDTGDTVPLTSTIVVNQQLVDDGAPRVDRLVDYADIDDQALLDQRAPQIVEGGPAVPSVTVRLPEESVLGPGILGDTGRVVIRDIAFAGGVYDEVQRVIGIRVEPAERSRPEQVTFEFQPKDAAA